jgi:hypothetical protein
MVKKPWLRHADDECSYAGYLHLTPLPDAPSLPDTIMKSGGLEMNKRIPLVVAIAGLTLAGCNTMQKQTKILADVTDARFVDITAASGILTKDARSAGWADYNSDGCVDLLVTQASSAALFRNNCNGTFSNVTAEAGLSDSGEGIGVAWADYDGDGHKDFYISNPSGGNKLYRNRGDGTFEDVSAKAGVDDPRASTAASWGDFDHDGDLDLFVANRFYPKPESDITDSLFRNNGDGSFTEVGRQLGIAVPDRKTFMGTWFDYDRNGTLDLYLAVDFGDDILFSNDGRGNFTNVSARAGIGGPDHAMGVGLGDINGDGCHDLISTNNTRGEPGDAEHGPSTLYVNDCKGGYSDQTTRWGVEDRATVDWGVGFVDWDNDGDEDVAIVSGGMLPGGDKETNVIYENTGNGLVDVTRTLDATVTGAAFGSAWADFDNDGDIDWFIANSASPAVLLENRASSGKFVKVKLNGAGLNSDGVGARIEMKIDGKTQVRTVQAGKGYGSSEPMTTHFGVGSADRVDSLTVYWVDGTKTELQGLKTNQTFLIRQMGS